MHICFVEPFFSGSHATWLNELSERSRHRFTILSQRGRFWKWRMHGAAYTMARAYEELPEPPDCIIVSDMLDLAGFLALTRRSIPADVPVGIYFHENQVAYPWQEGSEDLARGREVHYAFINYQSALAADFVLFNSAWNRDSFLDGMADLLRKMPDDRHRGTVEALRAKSRVLPIGMDLARLGDHDGPHDRGAPLVLWNHRLEHDKDPATLLEILVELAQAGVPFHLALLTEVTPLTERPVCDLIARLGDRVTVTGMLDRRAYAGWLHSGLVLPVTSRHDFFGISIMEAVWCGCRPLLPRALAYPELYHPDEHPELFYDDRAQLADKLAALLTSPPARGQYVSLAAPYDWSRLMGPCDDLLEAVALGH